MAGRVIVVGGGAFCLHTGLLIIDLGEFRNRAGVISLLLGMLSRLLFFLLVLSIQFIAITSMVMPNEIPTANRLLYHHAVNGIQRKVVSIIYRTKQVRKRRPI